MKIKEINKPFKVEQRKRLVKRLSRLEALVNELNTREIPDETTAKINLEVDKVNSSINNTKYYMRQLRKALWNMLKVLEKDIKVTPKNFYRNRWMAIGISVFGVSFGTAFGASLGNMSYISIGIPLGMVFGMVIGASMDKKALESGRQLKFEV